MKQISKMHFVTIYLEYLKNPSSTRVRVLRIWEYMRKCGNVEKWKRGKVEMGMRTENMNRNGNLGLPDDGTGLYWITGISTS